MGNFFRSCLNGLTFAVKPWLAFGIFLPIIFFVFHPIDPMLFLGVSVIGVVAYYSIKWKKEMPAAQQATEEAVKAGAKFVEKHPTDESKESPLKRYKNKFYPAFWTALLSASMLSCSYQYIYNNTKQAPGATIVPARPSADAASTGRTVAAADSTACTVWSADNIQMVHLEDADQYVTNCDSILSPETVASMNATLKNLDSINNVKSSIVICHQVEGGDTYRTAVDLINKYHIGHRETGRGLCVVVAYDQRHYTIAPSSAMESELTDIECNQLGRDCLQPYLTKELPDSAMLCLTQAIHALVTTNLEKEAASGFSLSSFKKKGIYNETGVLMLLILLLSMAFGYYDDKNKWNKPANLLSQPTQPEKPAGKDTTKDGIKGENGQSTPPPANKGGQYGGGTSGGGGATGSW